MAGAARAKVGSADPVRTSGATPSTITGSRARPRSNSHVRTVYSPLAGSGSCTCTWSYTLPPALAGATKAHAAHSLPPAPSGTVSKAS